MLLRRLLTLLGLSLGPALAQSPANPPRDPGVLRYPLLRPEEIPAPSFPLLFSDSPENPEQSGLLYRDALTGRARVVAYHANGLTRPARLLVLARNLGGAPAQLLTLRRGSAVTPGADPLIGQQTLLRYFASGPLRPRRLAPSGRAVIFDSGLIEPGAVVSLMLDLDTSAQTELSVVLLAQGERPDAALPTLAPDPNHQRGTFARAERRLRLALTARPARLVFGGPDDPLLRGTDALTGRPQVLAGNYGLLYDLEILGAQGSLLAASPRGGAYRGTVQLQDGAGPTLALLGQGAALQDPAAPAALWRVRSDRLRLRFVPGNGSNLPLALVFYP